MFVMSAQNDGLLNAMVRSYKKPQLSVFTAILNKSENYQESLRTPNYYVVIEQFSEGGILTARTMGHLSLGCIDNHENED